MKREKTKTKTKTAADKASLDPAVSAAGVAAGTAIGVFRNAFALLVGVDPDLITVTMDAELAPEADEKVRERFDICLDGYRQGYRENIQAHRARRLN